MEYAECAICFDPLYSQECVALRKGSHRTCRHYYHKSCLVDLNSCPLCRKDFTSIVTIPNPSKNPRDFFQCIDEDGNGNLSYEGLFISHYNIGTTIRNNIKSIDFYYLFQS